MILQKNKMDIDMRHVFLEPTQNGVFFAGKIIMEMEPSKEPIPQIFSSKNLIIGSAGKPFWLPSDSAQQGVKLDS